MDDFLIKFNVCIQFDAKWIYNDNDDHLDFSPRWQSDDDNDDDDDEDGQDSKPSHFVSELKASAR